MELLGSVEEIRFFNEESGFGILVIDVGGENIVVTGVFPPIAEGESLKLVGEFITHPRFGRQLKVTKAERIEPKDTDAIFRFISSGLIKGIGPKTASAIIGRFGDKTLEIMEKTPRALASIKGISPAKAKEFGEEYKKHVSSRTAIMFLQDKGISVTMARKIYKKYGRDTVANLSLNPYTLIEDIAGIGFATADRIAVACGIEKNSEFRVRAGIICALSDEQSGNTFLYEGELVAAACKLLNLENQQLIQDAISSLIISGAIKVVPIGDKQAVFLRAAYHAESGAAVRLVNLKNSFGAATNADKNDESETTENQKAATKPVINAKTNKLVLEDNSGGSFENEIQKELDLYKKIHGIELNDEQKQAVINSLKNGISVITGGPGTGKTTIIKCLLFLFDRLGETYTLMAPTGRAAKRINESTGVEASTIHRALKLPITSPNPAQLTVNNVIVDEVSMMDIYLFNTLLKHIRDGTRLILLGDKDQLPSVGAGNVLSDLLQKMPCTVLQHIYRQAEQSLIIKNAHLINGGQMPTLSSKDRDFFFMRRQSAIEIRDTVTELVTSRLPAFLGVDSNKIQVLCPMKNGDAGTKSLNECLSNALNSTAKGVIEANGYVFRTGDKVMQTSNNYNQEWTRDNEKGDGVFNGDLGIIEEIFASAREVHVMFEDGRRSVYSENIDELIPAYAITVHKSQGSEFEAVVMPVLPGSPVILTRNLLYTAVTRAKRLVVLVGLEYGIQRMIDNNYIAGRNSALGFFVDEAEKNYQKLFGSLKSADD